MQFFAERVLRPKALVKQQVCDKSCPGQSPPETVQKHGRSGRVEPNDVGSAEDVQGNEHLGVLGTYLSLQTLQFDEGVGHHHQQHMAFDRLKRAHPIVAPVEVLLEHPVAILNPPAHQVELQDIWNGQVQVRTDQVVPFLLPDPPLKVE